jgi:uncharacterized membrane protein
LRFPSAFYGMLIVPLMWAMALRLFGRGRSGRVAALAAALLAALSPLYVYYAQEARMYTLLTFLGLLAGYALLRATADAGWRPKDEGRMAHEVGAASSATNPYRPGWTGIRRSSFKWWLLFVIASAALLYTHYFGVFLLVAYGVCFMIEWLVAWARVRPHWWALAAFAVCCLSIALLYLPWLPAVLNRYAADRSYWQGALKINEALRHLAISFTTGAPETMLERNAVRLLPWFGVALVVAAGALLWPGRRGAEGRRDGGARVILVFVYLSTCLLVPLLAVLLLASRTPKFNPRYLMLVSPAYLLILAGGIGALAGGRIGESANQRRNAPRTPALAPKRSAGASVTHHVNSHPGRLPARSLSYRSAQLVHRPGLHQGAVAGADRRSAGADRAGRGSAVGVGARVARVGLLRAGHPTDAAAGYRHPGRGCGVGL